MAAGVAALWAFGRLSNQAAIAETKRRISAMLYELRLFADEPKLIWQAQIGLLRANLRYLRLTLIPAAVIAIPMYFLLTQLDAFYGREPLTPGRSTLVTLHAKGPATLLLPDGFAQDAQPVRVLEKEQITWRVRALRPASGLLRVAAPDGTIQAPISAKPGLQRLSTSALIEIDYPPASNNWLLWFFVISTATALLLRRRMGLLL